MKGPTSNLDLAQVTQLVANTIRGCAEASERAAKDIRDIEAQLSRARAMQINAVAKAHQTQTMAALGLAHAERTALVAACEQASKLLQGAIDGSAERDALHACIAHITKALAGVKAHTALWERIAEGGK